MSRRKLQVNSERLWRRLEALGAINRGDDGSCRRLALTDADRAGRDLVVAWMRDAGMSVRVDHIGNIIGLRPGREDTSPVMTGSHIDTVATGGKYDGAYGVIAGIEAVRVLNEAEFVTTRPLAVTVFTNEEGARFAPDMMGSLVYVGGLPLEEALATKADDGATVGDELRRIGYAGDLPCGAIVPHRFIELHIEQGPVLDAAGETMAAVHDLQGISWQELEISGTSNHSGTTPMALRHDAGYCAARIAVFARELAMEMGGSQVATVGAMRLSPNLVNVIARRAVLTVDLRNTDDGLLHEAEHRLARFLDRLAAEEGVSVSSRCLVRTEPVQFDDVIIRCIEKVAQDLGQNAIRRMTSGAGHDAQMMSRVCPSGMIFVPSIGGVSHNPRERTMPEHLELGANALLNSMMELASA
jgi:N-carbamoyl-L-amino-acid hydrolase